MTSPEMTVRRERMHKGVCPEAAAILCRNTRCPKVYELVRKVSPRRQREIVGLMSLCQNFSVSFATALLALTTRTDIRRLHKVFGLSRSEVARFQQAINPTIVAFAEAATSYGNDLVAFTIVDCYVRKLLSNKAVARLMHSAYPEEIRILVEHCRAGERPQRPSRCA